LVFERKLAIANRDQHPGVNAPTSPIERQTTAVETAERE
jgi:hypothetical protein|tara:strand:- start:435 stop:551 length:117 start_codon:yes stop_codon:yes gene_type:complete